MSRTEVEAPVWLGDALLRMDSDPLLLGAALAHHHAMQLEARSPSYALLAYTAVLESIGSRYVGLRPCDQCGARQGAAARFRAALELVVPSDQAANLAKAYRWRSQTAHEGRLHGGEDSLGGTAYPGFFTESSSRHFRSAEVWPIRKASRDLLELAFRGLLPAP